MNILETAAAAGNFTKLLAAIDAAELEDTLNGDGPFTVLAPNDSAFAKIPENDLQELLEDKDKLTKVLTYHVIAGKNMAKDVTEMTSAKTIEGSDVTIASENGEVKVNDAKVLKRDIDCDNGVIHVLDTVLMPK
jgi:uncharacterized surface protein with fasciclin (FAS1) repeats